MLQTEASLVREDDDSVLGVVPTGLPRLASPRKVLPSFVMSRIRLVMTRFDSKVPADRFRTWGSPPVGDLDECGA